MPEMHLRHPGFTYSAFGTFPKKKKEYKILRNRKFAMYLSKRTRACFQHDMSIIFLIKKLLVDQRKMKLCLIKK